MDIILQIYLPKPFLLTCVVMDMKFFSPTLQKEKHLFIYFWFIIQSKGNYNKYIQNSVRC